MKIPYIFCDNECSIEAKKIKYYLEKELKKSNIPYIIEKDNVYHLKYLDKVYVIENIEELMCISKICVIVECTYLEKAKCIVDTYLDNGLDIACFPSSIFNKYSRFSNNLIRDGAMCITSFYTLLEYLKS